MPLPMPTRICFAYYWATSGGVERVILSRSEALLRRYPELEIEAYFYNDCGGVALMERYIAARNLASRFRVAGKFEPGRYDTVFVIDTPQLLEDYPAVESKALMECHTPYSKNRTYLKDWQTRLQCLIVPSIGFLRVIESECPALRDKIRVVRNFVLPLPDVDESLSLPSWRVPVFLYFAQINEHKNVAEFIAAISYARRKFRKEFLGIVCGQHDDGYPVMDVIEKHKARGSILVLPPVPFEKSHIFMRLLRRNKGVFVSCSKGESFGLSAAEAMTAGLPVILSDIAPHATLVSDRAKFLYHLGNVQELAAQMVAAAEQYETLASECLELARAFSEEAFLSDWEALFHTNVTAEPRLA
jgi:glycosyltransferase involved in cell wall biosynthesis